MGTLTIKNKRLKMSPGGLISLSVSARKALGMQKDTSLDVSVSARKDNSLLITSNNVKVGNSVRVSPKGQILLMDDAKKIFLGGKTRHYWMQVNDDKHEVKLIPY